MDARSSTELAGLASRRGRLQPRQTLMIDALAARFGGTAYAVVELARALAQREEVAEVIVVTRRGSIVALGLDSDPLVNCVILPTPTRLELMRRVLWESHRLPDLISTNGIDVVMSMSGMLPRKLRCRMISFLFNPVMFESGGPVNALRKFAATRTASRADFVAVPSEHMGEIVSSSIERPCVVVPLGVDHDVFAPAPDVGTEILCVADFYAHKRHELLLDAWLELPSPRPRLRLIGNPAVDPRAYSRLTLRLKTLSEPVVIQHGIKRGELVDAYHRARVFVIPSECESFCMPLVEAMACGIPAVARGLPSLREIAAGGARFIDDDDPLAWSDALRALLNDDAVHARARSAALGAAARFSWDRMATDLVRRLAGGYE